MAYLGRQPNTGVRSRYIFTATASQTTFSGSDDDGKTLKYEDAAYVDVFLNGVLLKPVTDYTATTKTSVVLTSGAAASDIVEIVAYDIANIADTVSKANGGTFDGNVNFTDNVKAIFGAGSDLQIYHDGSHSYVQDAGSGNLYLRQNGTAVIIDDGTNNLAAFNSVSGESALYYGGSGKKLATTSSGVNVTGTVTADGLTVDTNTLYVDSANNRVGVGTASPSAKIHSVDSNGNVLRLQRDGAFTGSWDVDIGTVTTGDFTIYDNENSKRVFTSEKLSSFSGTSALYIRNNGAVLINETSPWRGGGWFSIDASGRDGVLVKTESAGLIVRKTAYTNGFICLWENNGGSQIGSITTNGSTTAYNTSSDYRLKENVTELTGAIDRVKQVPVHRFNFIADPDNTVDGFLAHEVQTIVPESVHGEKDAMRTEEYEVTPAVLDDDGNVVTEAVMGTREVPEYQGIDQSKLVPLLTAALQEAITKIEALEARVATLENA